MADITLRAVKGSPLTNAEVDGNFTNLNTELAGKANTSSLSTVALSGAYSDLTGKPTIPSKTSDLTNDSGYITSSALTGYQPLDGDLTSIAGLAGTSGLLRKTAANTWSLDTNTYLTSFTETDPIFAASAAAGITATNITNWNTAYGWGNHATAGYLLSSTAATTYQTQAGMSSYLTTAAASTTYQPLDADLTSIAGLAGTSGILIKTAANTWALDTNTYLTGITSSQVTTALGYTPANKAGDQFTGSVGVGTSSIATYSGFTVLDIDNATNGGLVNLKKGGSTLGYINVSNAFLILGNNYEIRLNATGANPVTTWTNGSERMRVDSAGNVGIGTTAPGGSSTDRQLTVLGTTAQVSASNGSFLASLGNNGSVGYISVSGANPLAFSVNSSERLRIGTAGQIGLSGANYGTAGQVLTSQGPSSAPTWTTVSGAGGGTTVSISATAPASPTDGSLWWNSETGTPYLRYNDGNTVQWVSFAPGTPGPKGDAATLDLGTVTTVAPNVSPSITAGGTSAARTFSFSLPRAAAVSLGTTSTVNPNVSPSLTNTGTSGDAVLNFSLPRAATVSLGTVTTGAAGSSVAITNTGTNGDVTLNFTIPRGDTGATGPMGPKHTLLAYPSTADTKVVMFYTTAALTITKMEAVLPGGSSTPSVTYNIRHGSDVSLTGTALVTGGTTTTNTTNGTTVTSFNNASIAAGSFVWIEVTAVSGTVPALSVTLEF